MLDNKKYQSTISSFTSAKLKKCHQSTKNYQTNKLKVSYSTEVHEKNNNNVK
jgi:hypothetical protein